MTTIPPLPRRRLRAALSTLRKRRTRSVPTCRVILDLRGVPWGQDPAKAASLLRQQPGVLDVRIDLRKHRAIVVRDARTSLPRLWNWLVTQSKSTAEASEHRATN